ncbi:MAG: type 4a pilus biogenesis protein PilO [Desulfosudaceae bacterium]
MKKGFEKYSDKMQPLFEAVGKLTMVQRVIISAVALALLIAGFFLFSFKPQMSEIKKLENNIKTTEKQLVEAKKKAAQLDGLQKEWESKQAKFAEVMNALPDKKEIPSLLEEISAAGKSSGLDFQSFTPKEEVTRDFYAEIPVSIQVNGSYDRIQLFFQKVAGMSRVVSIEDIKMTTGKDEKEMINTSCTAVTYRFLSETPKGKGKK